MSVHWRLVWLTLHEPRSLTAIFVTVYLILVGTGLGTVLVDHGTLPVGVWSARHVSAFAFIIGGTVAAPMAWRGVWWVERIAIPVIQLGLVARLLAISAMGDAMDDGKTIISAGLVLAFVLMLGARALWVKISPYRADAGPIPAELEAALARARIEAAERRK